MSDRTEPLKAELQEIERIIQRAGELGIPEGWRFVARLPKDRHYLVETPTGWDVYTKDEVSDV